MPTPRLLIIGLDCMEPSLVFDQWRQDLPNLSRLMEQGSYGRLESSIPAHYRTGLELHDDRGETLGSWEFTDFAIGAIATTTAWPSPTVGTSSFPACGMFWEKRAGPSLP